jgi:hypothetical protein
MMAGCWLGAYSGVEKAAGTTSKIMWLPKPMIITEAVPASHRP